jgi:polyprenyl-phospho-N-acetylgalactosaminyl synthase
MQSVSVPEMLVWGRWNRVRHVTPDTPGTGFAVPPGWEFHRAGAIRSAVEERRETWVVIAAFNEGAVIRDVVGEVVDAGWSVVVVDDGSRDDTPAKAREAGAIVVRHSVNLGQGAALQTGVEYAKRRGARSIVTFDADGQHVATDIPAMVAALAGADIALGSRFLGKVEGASKRRMALLRTAVVMSNTMSGMKLTDAHCGFRAFRAEIAPRLRITQDRMAHASELLRKINAPGLRVVEVPVTVRYTEHSMRKGQGGIQAIRILFDYFFRASPR